MKFLISPATPDLITNCGKEGMFKSVAGGVYLYEIDYEEGEMIRITDSIGRMVPLDISEVKALAEVLCRIVRNEEVSKALDKALLYDLTNGANILP